MHYSPFFLFCFFAIQTIIVHGCFHSEREGLLEFKAGVSDPSGRLVSWRGEDCCTWAGIKCSNQTGHVVKLDLANPYDDWYNHSLSGEISPSLLALDDLKHLDLSNNFFHRLFPKFVCSFRKLKHLNLSYMGLTGNIPSQLSDLSRLQYVDLSYNDFSGSTFPKFICSFRKLRHLDLSQIGLSGMIPSQLSNLSRLQYLNLGNNPNLYTTDGNNLNLYTTDIWLLSKLTFLKYLDISWVNLQDSKEWVQALNMLPSLETLYLEGNNLTTIPTSLTILNFSSLTTFYLANQNFNAIIPAWMGQITSLTELTLYDCSFIGSIPSLFGNFVSLRTLVLGSGDNYRIPDVYFNYFPNYLEGPIPSLHNLHNLTSLYLENVNLNEDISELVSKLSNYALKNFESLILANTSLTGNFTGWLDKMPNLSQLALNNNKLNETIPTQIGNLSNLVSLDLSQNSLTGEITEAHLTGLSNLKSLRLSSNSVTIKIASNWIPVFQLEDLVVGDCKLGPKFPSWLQNQTQLSILDLSNTSIVDTSPDWLWNFSSLYSIDLSHNQIKGKLPLSLKHFTRLQWIDLKHNQFSGALPPLPHYLDALDLSHNSLSGPLPLKSENTYLSFLILSNNFFNGGIGQSICGFTSLLILNLSGNNISGDLPHCWPKNLEAVDISNNKLSGTIPSSMGILKMLFVLQLNDNRLTGELPSSLQFCKNLVVIDLGENQFYGQIPEWLGETLHNLTVLLLRSNLFSGNIPSQLTHLGALQVLDLSDNNISGSIPHNLDTLMAMALSDNNVTSNPVLLDFLSYNLIDQFYKINILVSTKDSYMEYSTNIALFKSIDLSMNNLTGEIPQNIIALLGLRNLNLSYNNLNGTIPKEIGNLQSLESLDFRMNKLSGIIPYSMANLHFLTFLNLSHNNLSGEIPTGNQLQTILDPYIYAGNPYLCGSQINISCNTGDISHDSSRNGDYSNILDKVLLYLFTVLGFVFGFWMVFGVLIFKRNWRYYFFQIVDDILDKIYVFVMIRVARLKKNGSK